MSAPPGRPADIITSTGPLPRGRRGGRALYARDRRHDRVAIVQCHGCGASASGLVRDGRIVAANLDLAVSDRHAAHVACGGRVSAADIAGPTA